MARQANETVRLLYHSRTLLVAVVGMVGIAIGIAIAGGDIGQTQLGSAAMPLVGVTFAVLGVFAWLGWTDYVSATSLAIDARGVTFGWPERRTIPWSEVKSVSRGTGAFRLVLGLGGQRARVQLLVLREPIASLKLLVERATAAGANVEPYLARLAEHVDDDPAED